MTLHDFGSLAGRTVLITGGSGHIGSSVAAACLELGARVATADVSGMPDLGDLAGSADFRHHVVDLGNPAASADVVDIVLEDFGRLDVVVSAASWMGTDTTDGWNVPYPEQDESLWPEVLSVALTANFALVKRAAPALAALGCGSVVFICSHYGFCGPRPSLYPETGINNIAGYAASKGGLIQLARWLSTTMAPEVRVNALSPGGIFRDQDARFVQRYESETPLGRMGTEDDMVGPILFLASDLSRYMTGHNLVVDGGFSVW